MNKPLLKILWILSAFLGGALLLAFAILGWHGFIADSEIWAISNGKNFRQEWMHPWIITRPLFYSTLALFTAPFDSALPIFYSAKVLGILNGVLTALFSYRLAQRIVGRETLMARIVPWATLVFIFSNSGYMNQGYRIRSDLLSAWLVLFALERTFAAYDRLRPRTLAYWALPFLATPKAILHVLPSIALLKTKKERTTIFSVLLGCLFLITLVYPEAISYFLNTYTEPEIKESFFSKERLVYLLRILENNGFFFLVCLLRALTLGIRLRLDAFGGKSSSVHANFAIFTLASVVVAVLSPEKVPFYLASFLPLLGVFASLLLDDLENILPKLVPANRFVAYERAFLIAIMIAFLGLASNAALNWKAFRVHNNSEFQFAIITEVEKYLQEYPKATYYDVVGIVPQRATVRLFAGPNDTKTNEISVFMLETFYKPDLLFVVRRSNYLAGMHPWVEKNYFWIGPNAYARWQMLTTPDKLPLKSAEAEEYVRRMKISSGRDSLSQFSVLIKAPGKAEERRVVTQADLTSPRAFPRNSRLVAFSPFLDINNITTFLPRIIRFDWDWTGAGVEEQEESLEE